VSIIGVPIVENELSPGMCRFHPIIRDKVVAKGSQSCLVFRSAVGIRHYTCRNFGPLRQDSSRYVSCQRGLGEVGRYWGRLNGGWSEVRRFADFGEVFRRQQFLYWTFERDQGERSDRYTAFVPAAVPCPEKRLYKTLKLSRPFAVSCVADAGTRSGRSARAAGVLI
jgi:hypothetical protein